MYHGKTPQYIMNITRKVLQEHPYTITPPSHPGGRYQTYVKKPGEKRTIIRAATYDELVLKLYEHYFYNINTVVFTIDLLFEEWLSYKETITNSLNTIRRHEQHYKKYFSASWGKRKLKEFDKLELQKQCNLLVKQYNLSSKEWQNIKTIISGMFSYAYDKGYIKTNPMKEIKITVKFRQVNKKTGETETFNSTEKQMLLNYFQSKYSETGDSVYISLQVAFKIGTRVGELVALDWSDLQFNSLHVHKEEIKKTVRTDSGWSDVYEIVDHTKTHSDRFIPLVPSAIRLFNDLRFKDEKQHDNGYIFTRNGIRITSRQVTYALEKACSDLGLSVKRTHKIRKTVASDLNTGHIPLDEIRTFLGHSNLTTTLGYIYNPLTDKETYNKICKAL